MKKILTLFLMMILLAPSFPTAAKTNVQRVSVYKGNSVTVKSSLKKATFSSTDPSIATVNSKGKVKGVSEGECYVIATRKGKSEVFAVSVLGKGASKIDVNSNILAYLDGHAITRETTLSDVLDMFLNSQYYIYVEGDYYIGDSTPFSLTLYSEYDEIYGKGTAVAKIEFSAGYIPLLHSDAHVTDIYITPQDKFSYVLNTEEIKVPSFDKFDANDYFENLKPQQIKVYDYDFDWSHYASDDTKCVLVYTQGFTYYFQFDKDTGEYIKSGIYHFYS